MLHKTPVPRAMTLSRLAEAVMHTGYTYELQVSKESYCEALVYDLAQSSRSLPAIKDRLWFRKHLNDMVVDAEWDCKSRCFYLLDQGYVTYCKSAIWQMFRCLQMPHLVQQGTSSADKQSCSLENQLTMTDPHVHLLPKRCE